jgi:hypothetical protein
MFENRRWLIIPTSLTGSINFSEVLESGPDSLRISNDGTMTFVKYDTYYRQSDEEKTFMNPETGLIETVTLPEGLYGRPSFYSDNYQECNHETILEILNGPDWSKEADYGQQIGN